MQKSENEIKEPVSATTVYLWAIVTAILIVMTFIIKHNEAVNDLRGNKTSEVRH